MSACHVQRTSRSTFNVQQMRPLNTSVKCALQLNVFNCSCNKLLSPRKHDIRSVYNLSAYDIAFIVWLTMIVVFCIYVCWPVATAPTPATKATTRTIHTTSVPTQPKQLSTSNGCPRIAYFKRLPTTRRAWTHASTGCLPRVYLRRLPTPSVVSLCIIQTTTLRLTIAHYDDRNVWIIAAAQQ